MSTLNLQGPIIAFATSGVSVLRRSQQYIDENGLPKENPPAPIALRASVQPMGGRELLLLPEGERGKEWLTVHAIDATTQPLKSEDVATAQPADLVLWHGKTYKVMKINDWKPLGGFWQADCARVGQ